jgi:hypothetical protein
LHVRIEGEHGRTKYAEVKALETRHVRARRLARGDRAPVMRTQLARWFEGRASYDTIDEPERWR